MIDQMSEIVGLSTPHAPPIPAIGLDEAHTQSTPRPNPQSPAPAEKRRSFSQFIKHPTLSLSSRKKTGEGSQPPSPATDRDATKPNPGAKTSSSTSSEEASRKPSFIKRVFTSGKKSTKDGSATGTSAPSSSQRPQAPVTDSKLTAEPVPLSPSS
jgi:hypothetical protein